jgi:hypothetical protein
MRMKYRLIGLLAGAALVAASGAALAHHSFAMFDQDHPMELQGTVTEFKFTSPHTFILLEGKVRARARWCAKAGRARPSRQVTS